MKIAPGIHRIGDNSMINAYLIEQAGEVTIIDAGVSGFYKDIDRELAAVPLSIAADGQLRTRRCRSASRCRLAAAS